MSGFVVLGVSINKRGSNRSPTASLQTLSKGSCCKMPLFLVQLDCEAWSRHEPCNEKSWLAERLQGQCQAPLANQSKGYRSRRNLRVGSNLMSLVDSSLNSISVVVDVIIVLAIDEEGCFDSIGGENVQKLATHEELAMSQSDGTGNIKPTRELPRMTYES
jgi:hypothetical protein